MWSDREGHLFISIPTLLLNLSVQASFATFNFRTTLTFAEVYTQKTQHPALHYQPCLVHTELFFANEKPPILSLRRLQPELLRLWVGFLLATCLSPPAAGLGTKAINTKAHSTIVLAPWMLSWTWPSPSTQLGFWNVDWVCGDQTCDEERHLAIDEWVRIFWVPLLRWVTAFKDKGRGDGGRQKDTSHIQSPYTYLDWETHENSVRATDSGEAAKGET